MSTRQADSCGSDPVGGDVADPQTFNRYAYVANDPVNSVDPLGLLVCFLTYEYQYFPTTVEGEDAVGIRVVATQHCYDIGGGGGGRAVPGGDVVGGGGGGGGRWTFPGTEAIINKLNAIKKKIFDTIPSGRTVGVSGVIGAVGSVIGGGELLVNYDSGEVSAFGFGGTQVGWNGGLSGSVYSGYIKGLDSSNSNYSRGLSGVNGALGVGGGVLGIGGFAAASSGELTGGARGLVSLNPPVVVGGSVGASLGGTLG